MNAHIVCNCVRTRCTRGEESKLDNSLSSTIKEKQFVVTRCCSVPRGGGGGGHWYICAALHALRNKRTSRDRCTTQACKGIIKCTASFYAAEQLRFSSTSGINRRPIANAAWLMLLIDGKSFWDRVCRVWSHCFHGSRWLKLQSNRIYLKKNTFTIKVKFTHCTTAADFQTGIMWRLLHPQQKKGVKKKKTVTGQFLVNDFFFVNGHNTACTVQCDRDASTSTEAEPKNNTLSVC